MSVLWYINQKSCVTTGKTDIVKRKKIVRKPKADTVEGVWGKGAEGNGKREGERERETNNEFSLEILISIRYFSQ